MNERFAGSRYFSASKGFTLIEIVIAILLFGMVWMALVGTLVVGKGMEVIARHRVQATYAAQRAIELYRKNIRPSINVNEPNPMITTSTVTIDTRGTDDASDDVTGTQTITATSMDLFDVSPDWQITRYGVHLWRWRQVIVTITWRERLSFGSSFPMTETLGTYIANDPQMN